MKIIMDRWKSLRNHSEYAFYPLFPWLISIGDNVCIYSNVKILVHDTSTEYVNRHTKIGRVSIGNNVYRGYGAISLCDVKIGDNSIIGAGSVVTKDIPSDCVYAGKLAKYVCNIDEFREKYQYNLDKRKVY